MGAPTRSSTDDVDDLPGTGRSGNVDWSLALAATLADLGQPTLAAQPIADLTTGDVVGYELLARFAGPPSAPPDVWFRHADRLGLATALTTRVITRAFALRAQLPPGTFLAFNIEPHLLADPAVTSALDSVPDLDRIVVELTGHTPAGDERALLAAVDRVRQAGGRVAVDDTGTGYAGLRQLIAVRPDIVKVDRALVAGLDSDPIRRGAVAMLGELVSRMDARLLAEGVETPGELQTLVSLGVPLAQGWELAQSGQPWPALAPEAVAEIRRSAARSYPPDRIASLVRECALVPRAAWCASNVPPPGDRRTIVCVEPDGRPVGVVARESRGARYLAPVMAVAATDAPAEIARRAMARAACFRGVPLVCVDAEGHPLGVVDISELIDTAISGTHQLAGAGDRSGS